MILGIGVDLLHLPRLKSILTRHSPALLARRILNSEELEAFYNLFPDCHDSNVRAKSAGGELKNNLEAPSLPVDDLHKWRSVPDLSRWERRGIFSSEEQVARYLGVRWCVKEAAYKALNPAWSIKWKDIILRQLDGGKFREIFYISSGSIDPKLFFLKK